MAVRLPDNLEAPSPTSTISPDQLGPTLKTSISETFDYEQHQSSGFLWPSAPKLEQSSLMIIGSSGHLLLLFALLVMINLIVILGNILVILAVYLTAKLRSVTNIFIVSLATADLMLGVFVLPYALLFEIFDVWMFGEIWCRGWLVTDVWISTASILNLCAISVDRYVAVTRPVKYRSIMTTRRAKTIVAFVWIVSFLICFPPLLPKWKPSSGPSADHQLHPRLRRSVWPKPTAGPLITEPAANDKGSPAAVEEARPLLLSSWPPAPNLNSGQRSARTSTPSSASRGSSGWSASLGKANTLRPIVVSMWGIRPKATNDTDRTMADHQRNKTVDSDRNYNKRHRSGRPESVASPGVDDDDEEEPDHDGSLAAKDPACSTTTKGHTFGCLDIGAGRHEKEPNSGEPITEIGSNKPSVSAGHRCCHSGLSLLLLSARPSALEALLAKPEIAANRGLSLEARLSWLKRQLNGRTFIVSSSESGNHHHDSLEEQTLSFHWPKWATNDEPATEAAIKQPGWKMKPSARSKVSLKSLMSELNLPSETLQEPLSLRLYRGGRLSPLPEASLQLAGRKQPFGGHLNRHPGRIHPKEAREIGPPEGSFLKTIELLLSLLTGCLRRTNKLDDDDVLLRQLPVCKEVFLSRSSSSSSFVFFIADNNHNKSNSLSSQVLRAPRREHLSTGLSNESHPHQLRLFVPSSWAFHLVPNSTASNNLTVAIGLLCQSAIATGAIQIESSKSNLAEYTRDQLHGFKPNCILSPESEPLIMVILDNNKLASKRAIDYEPILRLHNLRCCFGAKPNEGPKADTGPNDGSAFCCIQWRRIRMVSDSFGPESGSRRIEPSAERKPSAGGSSKTNGTDRNKDNRPQRGATRRTRRSSGSLSKNELRGLSWRALHAQPEVDRSQPGLGPTSKDDSGLETQFHQSQLENLRQEDGDGKKNRGPVINGSRPANSGGKTGCALFDDKPYVIYSALGSFYIPMLIMIFFYSRIYLVASRAQKALQRGYMTTKWSPAHHMRAATATATTTTNTTITDPLLAASNKPTAGLHDSNSRAPTLKAAPSENGLGPSLGQPNQVSSGGETTELAAPAHPAKAQPSGCYLSRFRFSGQRPAGQLVTLRIHKRNQSSGTEANPNVRGVAGNHERVLEPAPNPDSSAAADLRPAQKPTVGIELARAQPEVSSLEHSGPPERTQTFNADQRQTNHNQQVQVHPQPNLDTRTQPQMQVGQMDRLESAAPSVGDVADSQITMNNDECRHHHRHLRQHRHHIHYHRHHHHHSRHRHLSHQHRHHQHHNDNCRHPDKDCSKVTGDKISSRADCSRCKRLARRDRPAIGQGEPLSTGGDPNLRQGALSENSVNSVQITISRFEEDDDDDNVAVDDVLNLNGIRALNQLAATIGIKEDLGKSGRSKSVDVCQQQQQPTGSEHLDPISGKGFSLTSGRPDRSQSCGLATTPAIVVNWSAETGGHQVELERTSGKVGLQEKATKSDKRPATTDQQLASGTSGLSIMASLPQAANQVRKQSMMLLSSFTSRSSQTLRRLSMVASHPVDSLLANLNKSRDTIDRCSTSSSGSSTDSGSSLSDVERVSSENKTHGQLAHCDRPLDCNCSACARAESDATGRSELKKLQKRKRKRRRRRRLKSSGMAAQKRTLDDYLMAVAGIDSSGSSDFEGIADEFGDYDEEEDDLTSDSCTNNDGTAARLRPARYSLFLARPGPLEQSDSSKVSMVHDQRKSSARVEVSGGPEVRADSAASGENADPPQIKHTNSGGSHEGAPSVGDEGDNGDQEDDNKKQEVEQKQTKSALHRQGACYERATSRAGQLQHHQPAGPANPADAKIGIPGKAGADDSGQSDQQLLQQQRGSLTAVTKVIRDSFNVVNKPPENSLRISFGGGGYGALAGNNQSHLGRTRRRGAKRTSRWHAKRLRAETKAAKTVAIIIGGFIFCWLPFFTAYLSRAIICERPDCIPQSLLSLFIWLGYLNSAINPVIYGLFSADFRHAFKNIVCRCRFRGTDEPATVSILVDSIINSIL